MGVELNKRVCFLFIIRGVFLIALGFTFFISPFYIHLTGYVINGNSDSGEGEWSMIGKYLNHTGWDGIDFPIIEGLNTTNFTVGGFIRTSPAIANGYVYISSDDTYVYQLNASNISQQIANYKTGNSIRSSPAVSNSFVYVGSKDRHLYQLNASNISQQIANYTTSTMILSSPVFANGYVYISSDDNYVYQLNASNISQQIANFSLTGYCDNTPTIAGDYIYFIDSVGFVYQLNASNISQQIANNTELFDLELSSSAVYNNFIYIPAASSGYLYQLNASNVSQVIDSYRFSSGSLTGSPAIMNDMLYIASATRYAYQVNASHISQQIASYQIANSFSSSPTLSNTSVYLSAQDGYIYQLNASNISNYLSSYYVGAYTTGYLALAKDYLYFAGDDYSFYQINATNISDTSPVVCVESWSCGDWDECRNYVQTRTCTDSNSCGTRIYKPETTQACVGWKSASSTKGGSSSSISSFENLTTEMPTEIQINNTQLDLVSIILTVKENVENGSITVSKINESSDFKNQFLIGKTYQSFEINLTGLDSEIVLNATINFKINKTWMAQNNITLRLEDGNYLLVQNDIVGNLKIYRNHGESSSWSPLLTNFSMEDENYYYFFSSSPGFSTFVIFFNEYNCVLNSRRCSENKVEVCLENATWSEVEICKYSCENNECVDTLSKELIINIVLVFGVSIMILIVAWILVKKIRKKNFKK